MAPTVYSKTAVKSAKGVVFAIGQSDSGYLVFKLCENYDSKVRGGISKTWRYVADKLTLAQAKDELNRRAGKKR